MSKIQASSWKTLKIPENSSKNPKFPKKSQFLAENSSKKHFFCWKIGIFQLFQLKKYEKFEISIKNLWKTRENLNFSLKNVDFFRIATEKV